LIGATSDLSITIWNIVYFGTITFSSQHSQEITSLVNINNELFATGSKDKLIFIWQTYDYNNYFIASKLTVHEGGINSLLFYPIKSYLLSNSYDAGIIVWKQLNNNLTQQTQIEHAHSRQTNDLIELSNNYLVSASDDFTLKVWDLNKFSNVYNLTGHLSDVYSIVELTQKRMASCSKDKSIIIWNTTNFQIIKYLFGHYRPVISLESIGDQYLASGSCDTTIRIWHLNNNYSLRAILRGHSDCVNVITFLNNSKLILSGSNDKKLIIWNSICDMFISF
jgi:WD40 repeat protein